MSAFVAGGLCVAYLVAALFFLKFWNETRDRLFAIFSIAFGVLATNRALLVSLGQMHEARTWLYLVRLLAFLLILFAILEKNRRRS
jgi:hypothetical protein